MFAVRTVYTMSIMSTPDVFSYLSYRRYLDDWFRARKSLNPRYSHRAFARKAGQSSPSLLLAVIQGKRNLTAATLEGFQRALGLRGEEGRFFEALVEFEQADGPDARNRAMERIRATRRFREARQVEGDAFAYLSTWYLPVLRELAATTGFTEDPEVLARAVQPAITPAAAREALKTLQALGLLRRDKDGRLRPSDASVVTPHEVQGLAVHNYHRGMMERALDSLGCPPEERHLCGVTVSIPEAMVPQIKRELDAFQERLLELCDSSEVARERVYQVNLQFFPLTRKESRS